VEEGTGLVVPAPGAPLGGGEHPANAAFAAQLDSVDAPLREKADFKALWGAFAAARAAGATIGVAPPLRFSGARAPEAWGEPQDGGDPAYPQPVPLPLNAEASFSLHVFNLSGIGTRLGAAFAELAPPPPPAGAAGVPWPALLEGCRAGAAAPAPQAHDMQPPPPTPAQLAHASFVRARARPSGAWGLQAADTEGGAGAPRSARSTSPPPGFLLTDAHEHTFRFASPAGRALVAAQDTRGVQLRALARGRGAALLAFPPAVDLPPFSHAVFYVGALADMPGDYADTLTVGPARAPRSRGEPRPPRPAPGTVAPALALRSSLRAEGNPLRFVPGTSGLSCKGVGAVPVAENGFAAAPPVAGTRGALLSFGDLPSNAQPLARTVTIENASPMDATITWHVIHDRAPHCTSDALAIALGVEGGGEEEEGGGGAVAAAARRRKTRARAGARAGRARRRRGSTARAPPSP
jgi:hypothetical protein